MHAEGVITRGQNTMGQMLETLRTEFRLADATETLP